MDGDVAKLDEIVALAERHRALVFVDDSHATGFMGPTGRGTHEHKGVFGRIDLVTTTLGKALGGASGGCVSGRAELVAMCRQRARPYLFSNTVPPVIVAGALTVIDLIERSADQRERLARNTAYWRQLLTDTGFDVRPGDSPIVPVMLYNAKLAQDVARDLFAEGVYVVGFFFPVVPKGQARIRTQVSAAHELVQLERAIEAFETVGRRYDLLGKGRAAIVERYGA
jgi:glycine C-acetyltransferase